MTLLFDPWLRKMCNAVVTGKPLNCVHKRNWSIACDLSESLLILRVAFLFMPGIYIQYILIQIAFYAIVYVFENL